MTGTKSVGNDPSSNSTKKKSSKSANNTNASPFCKKHHGSSNVGTNVSSDNNGVKVFQLSNEHWYMIVQDITFT